MSDTAHSFSVGWDVGAWRTAKGDALWILDSAGNTLGRWHGNLLEQIRESTSADSFVRSLFDCCSAPSPSNDCQITLAIDAPLAFPSGLAELLVGVSTPKPENVKCPSIDNPYLFRRTEAFAATQRVPKRNPLSPIQDQIGSQVTKVLHVLNKFGFKHDGKGVWRTTGSSLSVIEAYPAMSKTGPKGSKLLEPVKLIFEAQTAMNVPATNDERDALICAIVAQFHAQNPEALHAPEGEYFKSEEGWIWFPKKMPTETFDRLWEYCTMNNRLVPMPQKWSALFGMLKNTRQKPSGGWEPPLPLILAAWHDSIPIAKQLRFREHVEWAVKQDQLPQIAAYLHRLREDEWCHFGET